MIPTYIIILLGLLGLIVIGLIFKKTSIENFESKPTKKVANAKDKPKNSSKKTTKINSKKTVKSSKKTTQSSKQSPKQSIILDSLGWVKPLISECKNSPHKVALASIELDKMRENSPVKCYGLGTSNLEADFQKKNTKTILTGKKDVVALLWSEKDGKGRILGMIPNPTGTKGFFQKTDMMAKSITVKKRSDISSDNLDKLEFVLPPRRWTCIKNGEKYYPKVATAVYGNVNEDTRPVQCSTDGRPYFTDDKAKFTIQKKKPLPKPNPKLLEKKKLEADLQELKMNRAK
jgi:hypothetical protein